MENSIKMDDLGVPLFLETSMLVFRDANVFYFEMSWKFPGHKLGVTNRNPQRFAGEGHLSPALRKGASKSSTILR